jgi:hypothetical protein
MDQRCYGCFLWGQGFKYSTDATGKAAIDKREPILTMILKQIEKQYALGLLSKHTGLTNIQNWWFGSLEWTYVAHLLQMSTYI